MSDNNDRTVTFVLTGPREGFTGFLGGRYGFKDGELTVSEKQKDGLKKILCTRYACNIKGESPIWDTVEGRAIKVGEITRPEPEVTTAQMNPTPTLKMPSIEPKVDSKKGD